MVFGFWMAVLWSRKQATSEKLYSALLMTVLAILVSIKVMKPCVTPTTGPVCAGCYKLTITGDLSCDLITGPFLFLLSFLLLLSFIFAITYLLTCSIITIYDPTVFLSISIILRISLSFFPFLVYTFLLYKP